MSRLGTVDVVNAATLEKLVLTQRVSSFLARHTDDEERVAIENVARMLAQDMSIQVRESLAFELRSCKSLPFDLAAKIATDVESVAGPFLASTEAFNDAELAGLIPQLEEHAHVTLARRSDIGIATCHAIVTVGNEKPVSFLVRNNKIVLHEQTCSTILNRFRGNETILQHMTKRVDLPLSIVEQLILLVSAEYQDILVKHYSVTETVAQQAIKAAHGDIMWQHLEHASPAQIHAYVIDLRKARRLSHDVMIEMTSRGCLPFLESVLALEAGLTLGAVRERLYGGNMVSFVGLMKEANVSKADAQRLRQMVLLHGGSSGWQAMKRPN